MSTNEQHQDDGDIHDDSEVFDAMNNARGKLIVKRWFAVKEGWETE